MATNFSTALFPDNSTAAHFQAWATFFENTLVSGGWTVSTETGDTPPASLAVPTGSNQKRGFRVYKMADALQSTVPVFMRIDYGSGSGTNVPGVWITIGIASNGAGAISGVLFNGGGTASPTVQSNTSVATGAFNSYGSAANNRASIAMFVSTNTLYHFVFTIGRSKDPTGADTADGLMLVYRDGSLHSTSVGHTRYLTMVPGTQPSIEVGLSYVLTTKNPSETFGGDVGVGVISHFKGLAQQPGLNMLIVNSSDVSPETSVIVVMYGVSHTYIHLNALVVQKALSGNNTPDTNARCLMRYD